MGKRLRLTHRLVKTILGSGAPLRALGALPAFWRDWRSYRAATREELALWDLHPMLLDRHASAAHLTPHYFYQDHWAAKKVLGAGVSAHVDVGSRVDGFVSQCALFARVTYIDVRPLALDLENVEVREGTVVALPYPDGAVRSISCLHVIEHVGLGRYGDPIDPNGSRKAMAELRRVLAPGGDLYLGVPVGRERVCFNAHRVFDPSTILEAFQGLALVELSAVADDGHFLQQADPAALGSAQFACGLFHFRRV